MLPSSPPHGFSQKRRADQKSRSPLVFRNLHHRGSSIQNWVFYFLDPARGLGYDRHVMLVLKGVRFSNFLASLHCMVSGCRCGLQHGETFRELEPVPQSQAGKENSAPSLMALFSFDACLAVASTFIVSGALLAATYLSLYLI